MNYYKEVLKKYAVFTGRATRAEYWNFQAVNFLIVLAISFLGAFIKDENIIIRLYCLALFLPTLGVTVRRLHDIGRSGWMVLVSLIPLAGFIWILVLMCLKGDVGDNKYNSDLKMPISPSSNPVNIPTTPTSNQNINTN